MGKIEPEKEVRCTPEELKELIENLEEGQILEVREVFCILNCTTKSQVINMNIVSMGTINASLVTGREVFKSAILSNASYVILLHNHPSGDPQPSSHDFLVTSKLCAGGNILGIDVLDHIIVGGRTGKYHSMAKEGELENLRTKLLESAKAVAEPLFQRTGKEKHRIRRI